MTAKKWLITFLCIALVLVMPVALFNYFVDPFGVFGEPVMDWYAYSMTMNPCTAKISYLDANHQNYDSYIIGSSSTGSYPVETLNQYFDARFYNLLTYDADMRHTEQLAQYVLEHYAVKNLVLNISIESGNTYGTQTTLLTDALPPRVDGSAALPFYLRYLFANPAYGVEKIQCYRKDTWLPQSFDAFVPESGAYDKSRCDAEPIVSLEKYCAAHPVFSHDPERTCSLPNIDPCAESVGRIVAMCEAADVKLTVLMSSVYHKYLQFFPQEQVRQFYSAIAQVCDFWDFSSSSVRFEPRYFYDETHLRNCVGNMAIARMCADACVYIPDDFGKLVTKENVDAYMDTFFDAQPMDSALYVKDVPVLMYHHLAYSADGNDMIITPAQFEAQIQALTEADFEAVSLEELYDYVMHGADLPEHPVVITFDDGYFSNYEYAFPILQKYNQKATIFAVGVSFGCSTYKDTGAAITPHFGAAEAKEMVDSGLISIQSHTFDMHQVGQYDGADAREGVLQQPNERESDYIAALQSDLAQSRALLEDATGEACDAIAFPYGRTAELTNTVVAEAGFRFSFSTEPGINALVRGLPQCLYGLQRFTVTENISPEALVAMCMGN